jgi:hypothetical protein
MDGKPGENGKNAKNVLASDVRDMLESLKGSSRLKMKAINGLEEALNACKCDHGGGGIGGSGNVIGDTTFITLDDTPKSYHGMAGKTVAVNGTETGLIFVNNVATDEKVKLNALDANAGYLDDKITHYGISSAGRKLLQQDGINSAFDWSVDGVFDLGATGADIQTYGIGKLSNYNGSEQITSVDWANRRLVAINGTSINLDWSVVGTLKLYGSNATIRTDNYDMFLTATNHVVAQSKFVAYAGIYDDNDVLSLSSNTRLFKASDGSNILDYSTPGEIIVGSSTAAKITGGTNQIDLYNASLKHYDSFYGQFITAIDWSNPFVIKLPYYTTPGLLSVDATGIIGVNTTKYISRSIVNVVEDSAMDNTQGVDSVFIVNGAYALTLPTAIGDKNKYTVKNNHSADITVYTNLGQTIDGSLTVSLIPNQSLEFISNGSNWFII